MRTDENTAARVQIMQTHGDTNAANRQRDKCAVFVLLLPALKGGNS
jgi:hypothetical protein